MPNFDAPFGVMRKTLPKRLVREDQIENYLVKECEALGVPCEKLIGPSGWFDRIVFWPRGRPSLVETKKPKGWRYEPLQKHTHEKYHRLGYDVYLLKTKPEVDDFIRSHVFSKRSS